MDKAKLLRQLPAVHELVNCCEFCGCPSHLLTAAARDVLAHWREKILDKGVTPPDTATLAEEVVVLAEKGMQRNLRPVINATGVVLHTNLGRAPLSNSACEAVLKIARGYCNLEMDLETGERGERYSHVEKILCRLTGAEAALVVNNNAGAVFLALHALARGELVEIGGSFRIPDVMAQSGAVLREVGTTNRTHPQDYERAVGPETGLILKVHPSNFRVVGFTREVKRQELVALGQKHHIPVIQDLGSGALFSLASCGIEGEPTAAQSIQAGADVVTFSGDKLLGGPQAGIILGKKAYVSPMKQHPLMRALRLDKMNLAALEATLRLYRDPREAFVRIPTLQMLGCDLSTVQARADALTRSITAARLPCLAQTVEERSQVGGGSVPNQMLPTAATALRPQNLSVTELEHRLRTVLGRITKGRLLLDARTLEDRELPVILDCLAHCLG